MLSPVPPREGVAKACASALRASILRGDVQVGERLPPERTLAATLGVNRATLRAALRELEASGLVTARQGSGYAVHDYRLACGPDVLGPLVDVARERGDTAALVEDLLLVRRNLARAVFERLAGRRLSRAASEAIARRIDALETLADDRAPFAELARADLDVLAALLDATGSPVLRLFFNPAASTLARIPELAAALYGEPHENVVAWRSLLAALREGAIAAEPLIEWLEKRDRMTVAQLEKKEKRKDEEKTR